MHFYFQRPGISPRVRVRNQLNALYPISVSGPFSTPLHDSEYYQVLTYPSHVCHKCNVYEHYQVRIYLSHVCHK